MNVFLIHIWKNRHIKKLVFKLFNLRTTKKIYGWGKRYLPCSRCFWFGWFHNCCSVFVFWIWANIQIVFCSGICISWTAFHPIIQLVVMASFAISIESFSNTSAICYSTKQKRFFDVHIYNVDIPKKRGCKKLRILKTTAVFNYFNFIKTKTKIKIKTWNQD